MSAILSHGTPGLGLRPPAAASLKPARIRERAIDAACFLLSLAGAGVLALVLMAATELPSFGPSALRVNAAGPPASHG
jgi:hypothetical protein